MAGTSRHGARRAPASLGLSIVLHAAVIGALSLVVIESTRDGEPRRATGEGLVVMREPPPPPEPEPEELRDVELVEPVEEPALSPVFPEPEPIDEPEFVDLPELVPFEHRDWVLAPPPEPVTEQPAAEPEAAPPDEPPARTGPVEVAPLLVEGLDPVYPRLSIRRGEQGTVACRMHVDADGRVTAVEVVTSSGHERLDASAREALATWRFRPGTVDGAATPTTVLHEVEFRLR